MTMITGKANIQGMRMITLKHGLRAEIRGMRLTRGRSCYSIIKAEFGLKGSKQRVLEQFERIIEDFNREHGFGMR